MSTLYYFSLNRYYGGQRSSLFSFFLLHTGAQVSIFASFLRLFTLFLIYTSWITIRQYPRSYVLDLDLVTEVLVFGHSKVPLPSIHVSLCLSILYCHILQPWGLVTSSRNNNCDLPPTYTDQLKHIDMPTPYRINK